MLLRLEFLHGEGGLSVPVRIGSFDGTTLIECHDPAAFLRLVLSDREPPDLAPDAFLRGVVKKGRGVRLQLFDSLGALTDDDLELGQEETARLLGRIG